MIASKRKSFMIQIRNGEKKKKISKIRNEIMHESQPSASREYLHMVLMKKYPLSRLWQIFQKNQCQFYCFAKEVLSLGIEKLINSFEMQFLPFVNSMISLNDKDILIEMAQSGVCQYLVDIITRDEFQYKNYINQIKNLSKVASFLKAPLENKKWQKLFDLMLFCSWQEEVMELYGIMINLKVYSKFYTEDVKEYFTQLFHRTNYLPQTHHFKVVLNAKLTNYDKQQIIYILRNQTQSNAIQLASSFSYKYDWFSYSYIETIMNMLIQFLLDNTNQIDLRNHCLKILHNVITNQNYCIQCCKEIVRIIGSRQLYMLAFDHELVEFPYFVKRILNSRLMNDYLLKIVKYLVRSKIKIQTNTRIFLLSTVLRFSQNQQEKQIYEKQYEIFTFISDEQNNQNNDSSNEDDYYEISQFSDNDYID